MTANGGTPNGAARGGGGGGTQALLNTAQLAPGGVGTAVVENGGGGSGGGGAAALGVDGGGSAADTTSDVRMMRSLSGRRGQTDGGAETVDWNSTAPRLAAEAAAATEVAAAAAPGRELAVAGVGDHAAGVEELTPASLQGLDTEEGHLSGLSDLESLIDDQVRRRF